MRHKYAEQFVEKLNYTSHGIGALLMLCSSPFLVSRSVALSNNDNLLFAVICFILGLSAMLITSTMYHYSVEPAVKLKWKAADHISIYLAIAGSYIPFMVIYIWEGPGKIITYVMAICVVLGTIFKLLTTGKYNYLSTLIYVIMGLSILWISGTFFPLTTPLVKYLIIAGGVSYLIGVIFYLWKNWLYSHPVWHLFVLGGVTCHWCALWSAIPYS